MEGVKAYVVSWLDWGAEYVRNDPEDFFTKLAMILLPMLALSGVLAYILIKQIDKEEKVKEKKEKRTQFVKKARKAAAKKSKKD